MAQVLLIEDDDSVRTMLRLTLVHSGHSVIEARNGKEGLARFEHANVDLVITDIVMPEKDGLEVLMELRHRQPSVKIIAISGADSGDYLRLGQAHGRGEGAPQAVYERTADGGDQRPAAGRSLGVAGRVRDARRTRP